MTGLLPTVKPFDSLALAINSTKPLRGQASLPAVINRNARRFGCSNQRVQQ